MRPLYLSPIRTHTLSAIGPNPIYFIVLATRNKFLLFLKVSNAGDFAPPEILELTPNLGDHFLVCSELLILAMLFLALVLQFLLVLCYLPLHNILIHPSDVPLHLDLPILGLLHGHIPFLNDIIFVVLK